METPCDWAAKAKNDKGQTFKLTNTSGGQSTEAVLENVNQQNIGGGYTAYMYMWRGPDSGPNEDGIYVVSGGTAGTSELFLVVSNAPGDIIYAATITCQAND